MRTLRTSRWSVLLACAAFGLLAAGAAPGSDRVRVASTEFELPKAVTPAVRAACEGDVRRLCVHKDSTADTVKACVYASFFKFNLRCQQLALQAGLSP